MAISVLSGSPQAATPVYNKMLFKVSGSLTSATNYRYVCDVKNAAGTTTLARLKCDKLPTTNYGFFDVSRVVETLIAPTMPSRLERNIFYDHSGFYSGYQLTFMEEYGSTPVVQTGTTTNVTGNFAFAGNLDQLEFDNWNTMSFANFSAPSGRVRALTLASTFTSVTTGFTAAECKMALQNTPNVTTSDAVGWVAIGSPTNDYWTEVRIIYYDANGNITRNYYINNTTTSGSVYKIVRFGSGGDNISSISSIVTSDGQNGSTLFPTNEGAGYSIHFERSGFMSQPVFYRIGSCQRFAQPVEVYFVNRYGGVDTFVFNMKNRKRANIQRDTFGYNSDVYATKTYEKVWAGSYDYVFTLNSDWLTDNQSAFLIDLLKSSQVQIYYKNNDITNFSAQFSSQLANAIINTNQYQFVTRRNDRLQQLQIEVAVAYKNSIL